MSLDLGQAVAEAVRSVVREEIRAALKDLRSGDSAEAIEVYDVEGVAALCHVKEPAVRGWCRSGKLVAKKVGRGYLVEKAALQRFLSTGREVAPTVEPEADARRILGRIRGGK